MCACVVCIGRVVGTCVQICTEITDSSFTAAQNVLSSDVCMMHQYLVQHLFHYFLNVISILFMNSN